MTSLLSIHSHRPTDVEFDVSIQGVTEETPAAVRFVVESHKGYDVSILCEQVADNKFRAKIPSLDIEESEQPYRIEVIVDGYYFSPSRGSMKVAKAPRVAMESTSAPNMPSRPQVTATVVAPSVKPRKTWIKLSEMSDRQQSELRTRCVSSAKIMATASQILRQVGNGSTEGAVESQALGKLFETVRNACDIVETSIVKQV